MKRSIVIQTFLFLLMFVVGLVTVAQLRTQGRTRATALNRDDRATLLSELVHSNRDLRNEIASLEKQLAAYEKDNRRTVLEELVAELNRVKVVNGMIEVSGPGVELLIDGPLSALDVQDLVNELRNAGAEAIALNDQRLVAHSVLSVDSRDRLMVDGQYLSSPYHLQAIGNPSTIETALLRPGGATALLQRAYPNLAVQSTQQSRLVLGVHRPQMEFQYAQPAE